MFEQGQYKNSVMREPFAIQVSEKFRHQAIYHSIKLRHMEKESDKSVNFKRELKLHILTIFNLRIPLNIHLFAFLRYDNSS